eukprot:GEMP01015746.1.p2 GENE.GEMP01015746.1~~GEMP01015746.1.p2  ORF type:complete len:361 (+),score=100.68 GEMP01015746.1:1220-2302(+)
MTGRDLPWAGHLPEPASPTVVTPERVCSTAVCVTEASSVVAHLPEPASPAVVPPERMCSTAVCVTEASKGPRHPPALMSDAISHAVVSVEAVSVSPVVPAEWPAGIDVPETVPCRGADAEMAPSLEIVVPEVSVLAWRDPDAPKAGSSSASSHDTTLAEKTSRNKAPVDTFAPTDAPSFTARSNLAFTASTHPFAALRTPFMQLLRPSGSSSGSTSTPMRSPSNAEVTRTSPLGVQCGGKELEDEKERRTQCEEDIENELWESSYMNSEIQERAEVIEQCIPHPDAPEDPKAESAFEQWVVDADGDKSNPDGDDGYLDDVADGKGEEAILMSFFSQSAATFGFNRAKAMSLKYRGTMVPM